MTSLFTETLISASWANSHWYVNLDSVVLSIGRYLRISLRKSLGTLRNYTSTPKLLELRAGFR
jgi:hypothetical protein